jgi:hypothetical protein
MIKAEEMNRECSTHGEKRTAYSIWWESQKREDIGRRRRVDNIECSQ